MSTDAPLGPIGGDRFEILRTLGEGGMGIVYEAHDKTKNARVALKTMQSANPGALMRFKKEFRALADLAHPNLAALHELHVDGAVPFFTMELVRGVDFLSYVRGDDLGGTAQPFASTQPEPGAESPKPAGVEDARTVRADQRRHSLDVVRLRSALRQLVVGVQALHDAGKLHRDLKPSNVLVTREGRVVILDFGLVADIDPGGEHATEGDMLAGTAEYMSPEQAACVELTEASDWYSVGTIIYEALTERLPFIGPRTRMLSDKQVQDPPAPANVLADVPDDLGRLAMEMLSRDPATRPKGNRLLDRLGVSRAIVSSAKTSNPGTSQALLVGREPHMASLAGAFARVVSGGPAIVHVRGQSGMGKSTLVRRAIESMTSDRDDPVVVLSGRCYEQESVPYKAVDSVIDSLSRYLRTLKRERVAELVPSNIHALARLFPVLRRVEAIATAPRRGVEISDPHELRRRAFGALRDLLTRIAERNPLIVWIDDLQWGDVDSGMLLGELLRPPDPPPFLLIVSYRTEADADVGCLAALRRVEGAAGGAETSMVEVAALADDDAKRLAVALTTSPNDANADDALESIVRESAGNPFLLAELVRYQESGAGLRRSKSGRIHLEDVLSARLSEYSEDARLLLDIVAAAGRPIALDVTTVAAELSATAARTAVAQLRAAQLVRTARVREQDGLDTFHDRIRETVIRLLDPGTLARRHARLVGAIESSREPDPEALATHCFAAGDRERAGAFAEQAGDDAVRALAFDRAAEWFRRATELRTLSATEERTARAKLSLALANAGRGREAGQQYLLAATGSPGPIGLDLRRQAAEQFLTSGCMTEGIAVVRQVLRAVGASYPESQLLTVILFLWTSIVIRLRGYSIRPPRAAAIPSETLTQLDTYFALAVGLSITDTLRGRYFGNRFLLGALRLGEPSRVARALVTEIANMGSSGPSAESRVHHLEALVESLQADLNSAEIDSKLPVTKGWARYFFGRFNEALPYLTDAADKLRVMPAETAYWANVARVWLSSSLWFLGRIRELNARISDYREDSERRGDSYMSTFVSIGYPNVLWLVADRPDDAIREATDVFERWSVAANDIQRYYVLIACAQADLYAGRASTAYARTLDGWSRTRRAMLLRIPFVRMALTHLRARAGLASILNGTPTPNALADVRRCVRALSRD
ncbi:MAG: serine/threonine-protein kinase PknK, partial [Polyangiales bacterium]